MHTIKFLFFISLMLSITSCISHKQFDYAPISSPKDLQGIYISDKDYLSDIIKVDYENDKRLYFSRWMDFTWSTPTLYKGKFDKKKNTFDTWVQRKILPFVLFYKHDFSKDKIGKSQEGNLIINHAYSEVGMLLPFFSEDNGSYITEYKLKKNEILIPYKTYRKWGYQDLLSNEVKIENIYDSVCFFQGSLARVMMNQKWGLIDKTGNIVIDQKYDEIKPIKNASMEIRNENKCGLLDSLGTEVVPCIYDKIYPYYHFKNGLRSVFLDGKVGIINKNYKLILLCEYDYIEYDFDKSNLFIIEKNKLKGLASENGVICPPIFEQLELVSLAQYPDILATVYYQDKAYYIDSEGYLYLLKKTNFFRDALSNNIPTPDYGNKIHYTELLKDKL